MSSLTRSLMCSCLLALIAGVSNASLQAQCSVSFTNSFDYDNGFNPKVAYAGKNVVEVHNAADGVSALWYHVGKLASPVLQYYLGLQPPVRIGGI